MKRVGRMSLAAAVRVAPLVTASLLIACTARVGTIPEAFHGTWSFDQAACLNPEEVKMVIGADGYRREEIDAAPRRVEFLAQDPPKARIEFDVRAEGMSWSGREEWVRENSGDRFTLRSSRVGELPAGETAFVRCG